MCGSQYAAAIALSAAFKNSTSDGSTTREPTVPLSTPLIVSRSSQQARLISTMTSIEGREEEEDEEIAPDLNDAERLAISLA